jgi:hypothetical protein
MADTVGRRKSNVEGCLMIEQSQKHRCNPLVERGTGTRDWQLAHRSRMRNRRKDHPERRLGITNRIKPDHLAWKQGTNGRKVMPAERCDPGK